VAADATETAQRPVVTTISRVSATMMLARAFLMGTSEGRLP